MFGYGSWSPPDLNLEPQPTDFVKIGTHKATQNGRFVGNLIVERVVKFGDPGETTVEARWAGSSTIHTFTTKELRSLGLPVEEGYR